MPAHRTKRHAAVVSAAVTRLLVTRVSKVGGIRPGLGAPRRSRTKAKAKATTTTNGSNKTNKARMILSPRRGGYVFDLTRSEATTVPSSWPTSLNSRTTSIRGSVSPAPSFHTARDRTPRDSPDVIPETSKGAIGVSVRAAPSVVCPPPPPRPQQPQPHRRRAPALPRKSKTLPKLRQRHSSTVDSDICAVESVERLLCPLTRAVLVDGVRGVCGHVFSRYAVLEHLQRSRTCPVCGGRLTKRCLVDAPEAERRSKDLEAEWLSRSALQQRRADILDLTVLTDSEPDVKPKLEPKEKAKRRSRPEVIDLSYL